MPDFLIVDGDGHVVEPDDLWTARMDAAKWGDWIPRRVVETEVYETVFAGGEVRGGGREVTDQICDSVGIAPEQFWEILQSLRLPGGSDPDARIADMDRDGIDAAVLFPSQGLFFGPLDPIPAFQNTEFVADCQRAYNDWLAEYCGAHPSRLFGVAAVPLQDVGPAVAEAERAVGGLGLRGVFIRPSAYVEDLPLNHPVYDPFWAACQDLDVAVCLHPGVHVDTPGACRKFGLVRDDPNLMTVNMGADGIHGGAGLGQAVGNAVDMIVSMGRLLMGGVCERFPRLRFVFLESGGGWVPTLLERMDEQVKAFPLEGRWLTLLPSEYFRRQCWVGFEAEEWNLAACAEFLGADRVLWASDYPHPEYHPEVVKEMLERIGVLPEADQRTVAGASAIAAYGLPLGPG